jgi:hypothetical protein
VSILHFTICIVSIKTIPVGNSIKIPAYYADHSTGVEIYHRLEFMISILLTTLASTSDGVHLTAGIFVRVALLPAKNIKFLL